MGEDVENVGYVIPTPVVHHFLNDFIRTGRFTGFPALGMQWQRMESEALRRSYKMAAGQKGVLVRTLNPTSDAASVLRPDDVITRFDGIDISNDGTVPFRTGERIAFSYLISNKYIGKWERGYVSHWPPPAANIWPAAIIYSGCHVLTFLLPLCLCILQATNALWRCCETGSRLA